MAEKPGAVIEENGNITNEFSYLVMNVDVKNLSEEDVNDAVWGMITLRFPGVSSDQYSKELIYLGEAEPRFKGGDYYMEHIPAGEHITMPLIFVVKDELLDGEYAPYLRIDSSGTANTDSDQDVTRYITLNK